MRFQRYLQGVNPLPPFKNNSLSPLSLSLSLFLYPSYTHTHIHSLSLSRTKRELTAPGRIGQYQPSLYRFLVYESFNKPLTLTPNPQIPRPNP